MATLIKTDGTKTEIVPVNGEDFSLSELREYVGGNLEFLPFGQGKMMIVNEDGKAHGLAPNMIATNMWFLRNYTTDTIVGDVVMADNSEIR